MGELLEDGVPPKKCQGIHVTNKKNVIHQPCVIYNHTLKKVDYGKYFSVNITPQEAELESYHIDHQEG